MKNKLYPTLLIIGFGFSTWTTAHAAAVFFSDELSFQAALGGQSLNLESFETQFTDAPTVNFSGFSVTAGGGIPNILSLPGPASGALPTDGDRTIGGIDFGFRGTGFTFEFDSPINAFGIDILGPLDVGPGTLTLSTSNGDSQVLLSGLQPAFEDFFVGVINDMSTFDSVTITGTATGDGIQLDRLQSGLVAPVPLPAAFWFLGTALLGLLGFTKFKTSTA